MCPPSFFPAPPPWQGRGLGGECDGAAQRREPREQRALILGDRQALILIRIRIRIWAFSVHIRIGNEERGKGRNEERDQADVSSALLGEAVALELSVERGGADVQLDRGVRLIAAVERERG